MDKLELGPNGGLVYCLEYIEQNLDWLVERMAPLVKDHYVLFDCPGQVELYTHHNSVRNIAEQLCKRLELRLVCTHLVDSHYCSDGAKFVSVLLTSLSTMLQLGMPHVNVLSKMDLIEQYGRLAFNLDFFTDVMDLDYLVEHIHAPEEKEVEDEEQESGPEEDGTEGKGMDVETDGAASAGAGELGGTLPAASNATGAATTGGDADKASGVEANGGTTAAPTATAAAERQRQRDQLTRRRRSAFLSRRRKLTEALCGLIQDYSLVSFIPMDVQDKESMIHLMKTIDKANGYVFGAFNEGNESIMAAAVGADPEYHQRTMDTQMQYMG